MRARQLVRRLRALGVSLRAEDEKLKYKAPHGVIGADLLEEIQAAKAEIMEILHRSELALHTIHYAAMRDGVKLSAEVFRPKRAGSPVHEPLPAVWCYERGDKPTAHDETLLDEQPWLLGLLAGGYVVVAVDVRGSGASTGERVAEFGPEEAADSYDVTEWIARQPFCDGTVGSFGDPYPGIAGLWAAGAIAPHLKAVVAGSAGVQHDETLSPQGAAPSSTSQIPVYQLIDWCDPWAREALAWSTTVSGPLRLTVGPWRRHDRAGLDLAAEYRRWFDTWLKGIDSGLMAEPAVRYFTDGAQPGNQWQRSSVWPPAAAQPRELHLHLDGGLGEAASPASAAPHTVDGTTALTYTSDFLPDGLQVTGHPVVHLFVSTPRGGADIVVHLEEVDTDGTSHYVTMGAGHVPSEPANGGPAEVVFDLYPASRNFSAGDRLRITVSCRHHEEELTPHHDPGPVIRVHSGGAHPSRIVLPTVTGSLSSAPSRSTALR